MPLRNIRAGVPLAVAIFILLVSGIVALLRPDDQRSAGPSPTPTADQIDNDLPTFPAETLPPTAPATLTPDGSPHVSPSGSGAGVAGTPTAAASPSPTVSAEASPTPSVPALPGTGADDPIAITGPPMASGLIGLLPLLFGLLTMRAIYRRPSS